MFARPVFEVVFNLQPACTFTDTGTHELKLFETHDIIAIPNKMRRRSVAVSVCVCVDRPLRNAASESLRVSGVGFDSTQIRTKTLLHLPVTSPFSHVTDRERRMRYLHSGEEFYLSNSSMPGCGRCRRGGDDRNGGGSRSETAMVLSWVVLFESFIGISQRVWRRLGLAEVRVAL